MSKLKRFLIPVALALAVLAAFGCSSLPTAPAVTSSQVMDASGAAQSSDLLGLAGGIVGGTVNLVVRTLNLVGSLGGSLTNGRWKVVIPPNAVDGSATVSLGVADAASAACQLEISPAYKNHFSTPVTLISDCSGVPDAQLRSYVISWYDPATKQWVPVEGSKVDLVAKTVSAPLQHFSSYSCGPSSGKAGW